MKFDCWKRIGLLSCAFGFVVCLFLYWCWDSWAWNGNISLDIYWFNFEYAGSVDLEKVPLKTDDLDEIIDLYQEVWNNSEYKDSLLIAEKFAQWLWVNTFAQENLDTLEEQWLTIDDVQKTQILLNKYWEKINTVLVEYKISGWLISDLPLLYVSQLFVPKNKDMIVMSFITEKKSSHTNASNMFKNIK